jgi:hypothetical protein
MEKKYNIKEEILLDLDILSKYIQAFLQTVFPKGNICFKHLPDF